MTSKTEDKNIQGFNFGPIENEMSVTQVIKVINKCGFENLKVRFEEDLTSRESKYLGLDSRLASDVLGWKPVWTQTEAIEDTMRWWKKVGEGQAPLEACNLDLVKALKTFSFSDSDR